MNIITGVALGVGIIGGIGLGVIITAKVMAKKIFK